MFQTKNRLWKRKKIVYPQQRKRKLQKFEKNCSPILKENVGETKKTLSTNSKKKKEIREEKIVGLLQIMIFFYEVCDLASFCLFNLDF